MKKLIFLSSVVLILACNHSTKNLPKEFDFGKTENGVYTNRFFNMEIPFNPDWVVQDKQQMNTLMEAGSNLIAGDNKDLKSVMEASKINTAYLLTIFKYEVGSAVSFNPSFMVVAENTNNFPGIKNGKDYLFHCKNLLQQSQVNSSFEKEIYEQKIGTLSFHIMEVKLNYMGTLIIQEFMSTVTNGFSLTFTISYTTDDEKKELQDIVDRIKI